MRKKVLLYLTLLVWESALFSLPQGFHLKEGEAKPFVQNGEGTWILESGKKTWVDWDSFNIELLEKVRFQQSDEASRILNRVIGSLPSSLLGELSSNGAVYLINENGILIGKEALIDTAGFIASTLNFSETPDQFFRFEGDSAASVVNYGRIVSPHGDIFLIGRVVENHGTIIASEGRQGLLSGCDILIRGSSSPIVRLRSESIPDKETLQENPYAAAICQSGEIRGKEIYLIAEEGGCEVGGTVCADTEEKGGTIHLLGDQVIIQESFITASGKTEGGEILIGGDFQGNNPLVKNAQVTWVGKGSRIAADATEAGNGGKVIIWSDRATGFYGEASIRGGPKGGDGGFAEVSGQILEYGGIVDAGAAFGMPGNLLLDPNDIQIAAAATTGSFSACPSTYNIVSGTPTNQILATDLSTQLGLCNVTISTVGSAGAGPNNGSITVSSPVSWSTANTLTLTAASYIVVSSTVQSTFNSSSFTTMNFTANGGTASNSNDGILISGSLSSLSGNIVLTGTTSTNVTGGDSTTFVAGVHLNGGTITTGSGSVTLTGTCQGTPTFGAGIQIQTNNAIVSSGGGAITLSGMANVPGSFNGSGRGVEISNGWTTPATSGDFIFQNCWGGGIGSSFGIFIFAPLLTNGNITATQNIRTTPVGYVLAGTPGSPIFMGGVSTSGSGTIVSNGGNIHILAVCDAGQTSGLGLNVKGVDLTTSCSTSGSGSIQITGVVTPGSPAPTYITSSTSTAGVSIAAACTTVNGDITIAGKFAGTSLSGLTSVSGVRMQTAPSSTTGTIYISGETSAGGTAGTEGYGVGISSLVGSFTTNALVFGATITDGSYTISGCKAGSAVSASGGLINADGLSVFLAAATTTWTVPSVIIQNCEGGTAGAHGFGLNSATPGKTLVIAGNVQMSNIIGHGPSGCGFLCNHGLTITGANNSLTITGAQGSPESTTGGCHGVSVASATLQTTGSGGTINITGTGGQSSTASNGVDISGSGIITTAASNATITLTGTAGSGSAGGNGIALVTANPVTTVSGGLITLNGTGSPNAAAPISHGVLINTPGAWNPGSGVAVTFGTCSGGVVASSNGVQIAQAITASGTLSFTNCTGSSGGGNGVNVANTITVSSGNLVVTSATGGGPSGVGFASSQNVDVQGAGNTISITGFGTPSSTTGACYGISLTAATMQTSSATGGAISLTGTGGVSSTASHGINISSTGVVTTAANNATLTLTGTGGTGSGGGHGINLAASTNSALSGSSGIIVLTGVGSSNATTASHGVSVNTNAWSPSTGTYSFTNCIGGAATSSFGISMEIATTLPAATFSGCVGGSGTNGHGWNIGAATSLPSLTVSLGGITSGTGANSAAINIVTNLSITSGNLSLTAASQGTGASTGIQVTAGTVSVVGSSTLSLSGTGHSSNTAAYGVHLSGGTVTSVNGALSITGVGGSTAANGVRLEGGAIVSTTGSGAISITSNSPSAGIGLGTCTIMGSALSGANITFNTPVVWLTGATPTLTPQGTNTATFASTLDGTTAFTENMTLNVGAANLAFNGAVGGTTPFNGISLIGGGITFNSSVVATQAVIQNSGTLTLGNSSSFSLLGDFLQTGAGAVSLGGSITNTGALATISFAAPVSLTNDVTLLTQGLGSSIHFANTVDDAVYGTHGLTVQSPTAQFDADLGGINPLASLTVLATAIPIQGNQTVAVGPMLYTGVLSLAANTMLFDLGAQGITLAPNGGSSVTGAHNLMLRTFGSTISVLGKIDLSGSSGGNGGALTVLSFGSATFSDQILTQGGDNGAGAGGNGGAVMITSSTGSVSVHNINTSGGDGTGGAGGNASNIMLEPASGESGGYPIGLTVLNSDLSSGHDGNLVALGGTGTVAGSGGSIVISANRTSYPTVATIVSDANHNSLEVRGNSFTMGPNETMTILGDILLVCPSLVLGDMVSLDSMQLTATTIFLNTHGDVSLLNNLGGFYTSPTLHFLGGSIYSATGSFVPSGAPLNAQGLGLPAFEFEPFLTFSGHILNFDTTFQPNPPPTPGGGGTVQIAPANFIVQGDFYKLAIADAQLSDLLPIYPHDFPIPFELIYRKKLKKKKS